MPDFGSSLDIVNGNMALRQYTSILFKSGSTYYAIKYDGTVISSGSTAETVIQAALDVGGTVYFADTGAVSWSLSAGFAGFTVDQGTYIICQTGSTRLSIDVPNGYAGIVFKFIGTSGALAETVGIDGLNIVEQGTPARNWTGIKFEIAGTDSLAYCKFKNIKIYDAGVGIELETSNSRWIESCNFEHITIFDSVVGMLFDQQSGNIHKNIFTDITIVCGDAWELYGFKNIDGRGNIFLGCTVWDIDTASVEANIKSTASGTVIIGGMMTGDVGAFIDQGVGTIIVDRNTKAASGLNVITNPDTAKFGFWSGRVATNGTGILDNILASIIVGTGAQSGGFDSTGIYRTYDTAATINSLIGLQTNARCCMRILNAYFKTAIYLNNNTNVRVFAGLVASDAAPASAADPLNALEGIGLWFDSAVSANWKIMHNDSSGASTVDDTTLSASTATLYPVEIYAVNDSRFRFVFNGVSTILTTNIPASTTALGFRVYMENTTGASRTMRHYYVTVRNDK